MSKSPRSPATRSGARKSKTTVAEPQDEATSTFESELRRDGELLARLKSDLPALEILLAKASEHWVYEDLVYRFYHQSFKVYSLQGITQEIVDALRKHGELNPWFVQIVAEGTGKTFGLEHNKRWLEVTRPIVEAFFHARYFLEMAVRYAKELDEAPQMLPSGWAAVLCLYNIR